MVTKFPSGNGGMSAATTVKRESPIVEHVSESELLPSMLVISGGEGYIDFRSGKLEDNLDVSNTYHS
jgi:hypothetical protein